MEKNVCLRQCVGCGEMVEKSSLMRIVKTAEGDIVLDAGKKVNGRGAYIERKKACMVKACKSKSLDRAFKIKIPPEVYDKLLKESEAFE